MLQSSPETDKESKARLAPLMNPGDYRRDFAAYCSTLMRERYNHHAGLTSAPRFEPIKERYSDLWTREALDDLDGALEQTPAQFETERAALRALTASARLNYLESSASEVSAELSRCTEAARVDWVGGLRVRADEAKDLIVVETDGARRRELAARWFDALRSCDDLRAARLESLRESARECGCGSLRALFEETAGVDWEALAASARAFLERTASAYHRSLARWKMKASVAAVSQEALSYADALSFERATLLDDFFRALDVRAVYAELMRGLGVRVERQTNLQVDDAARPSKKRRAASFGVTPPTDVRLVFHAEETGTRAFVDFLREAGRAQSLSWASKEQATRYPEFVYPPDSATEQAHGFLFANLLTDAAWLGELRGVRATEAHEAAGALALVELYEARRTSAALLYAQALSESADVRSDALAETYSALYTEATGFRHDPVTRLFHAEEAFAAVASLRARLFAVGWRDYLRGRHGRRWYASRAAGDELIDIWNTASRYGVEELARLVGVGELSFELLADELTTAVASFE
ncbi:MAG TPA: hypothetical protein VGV59_16245 [Pyrinomonadaceae bacterium]|nr:hypothetical protein [Pyrinomonadaceae bacterium]